MPQYPPADLRPCPFCAHEQLVLAAVGRDAVERIAVMCPECGAVGPMTTASDPPGHADHLSNQRFGADHQLVPPLAPAQQSHHRIQQRRHASAPLVSLTPLGFW